MATSESSVMLLCWCLVCTTVWTYLTQQPKHQLWSSYRGKTALVNLIYQNKMYNAHKTEHCSSAVMISTGVPKLCQLRAHLKISKFFAAHLQLSLTIQRPYNAISMHFFFLLKVAGSSKVTNAACWCCLFMEHPDWILKKPGNGFSVGGWVHFHVHWGWDSSLIHSMVWFTLLLFSLSRNTILLLYFIQSKDGHL